MKLAMPMHGYAFRFTVAHEHYEKLATGTYGGPDACFPPYLWRLPFFYLDVLWKIVDMHSTCNACANGNALKAQRIYAEQYPERRLPDHTTFTNIYQRVRGFGKFEREVSVKRKNDSGRIREVRIEALEEDILNLVEGSQKLVPGT
ncbi:hypothetical protein NQ318_000704 [Aromia moschata]|uniref:DUF4817 domain-containing protein n=1 Tax=Aromia moschata TaxID=1265417 RepID=A0AAV8XTZ2_9CUCU|nr:hypothetical protein NQ318_000704 [Aromia moschata]